MLIFGSVAIGEELQIVFAEGFQEVAPGDPTTGLAAPRHPSAKGECKGQTTALLDHFHRFARQLFGSYSGRQCQHEGCLGFGRKLDLVVVLLCRQSRDETRIARGEQEAAARTDNIERLRVVALPDIIEYQERGTVLQQVAKPLLSNFNAGEILLAIQRSHEPPLAIHQISGLKLWS